jgi:hypothetical protein
MKDDKPVLMRKGQSFVLTPNPVEPNTLRPFPKPGESLIIPLKGDKGDNPSSYTF